MTSNSKRAPPSRTLGSSIALLACLATACIPHALLHAAGEDPLAGAPAPGESFTATDALRDRPVYECGFDRAGDSADWVLEGGRSCRVEKGCLLLESAAIEEVAPNQLVCWLKREAPADFLLEFTVRPEDRSRGLNIVFFNARGVNGQGIFDPSLAKRNGSFGQYVNGDLQAWHISYWAGGRGTAHLRRDPGLRMVAVGKDLVTGGPVGAFQRISIHKRGGLIRLAVDDQLALEHSGDGSEGNVPGWVGLRQMALTRHCEYDSLALYPLAP